MSRSAGSYEQQRREGWYQDCRPRCRPPPPAHLPCSRLPACLQAGPRDTPYDSGVFYVNIELDDQYPFVPPKMRFIPNVRISGRQQGRQGVCQRLCYRFCVRAHGHTIASAPLSPFLPPIIRFSTKVQPRSGQCG